MTEEGRASQVKIVIFVLYNRQVRSLPVDAVLKHPLITYPILIVFFGMAECDLSMVEVNSIKISVWPKWVLPSVSLI